ncbi:MAG: LCP family protein [Bacteroidales bacterium]
MGKVRKKKIAVWISGVIVTAVLAGFTYVYSQMNKVNTVEITKDSVELNISDEAAKLDSSIINIALFGLSMNPGEDNSTDSIMILSIDQKRNKLKVSSIMRDTYVELADGRGANNIKNAYRFGGPALAIKTLNSNYDLNIESYVTVNYEGFEELIDSIGGVEIDIKDYEVPIMKTVGIYSSGKHTLSGKQALAYSRDRKLGNGDFERTERHRTVLTKAFEKMQSVEIAKYPAIVSGMLPYLETNMNKAEIISLATTALPNMKTLEPARFPVDGYWFEDKKLGEYYYIVANIKTTAYQMHRFIYYDSKPVEKY